MIKLSTKWHCATTKGESSPILRFLSDEDFEREIAGRTSACENESCSQVKACIMHFDDAPDELIIRKSMLPKPRFNVESPPKDYLKKIGGKRLPGYPS